MNKMIKFSIIIASYNGEKYIENCISNIKKQSFKNYEIIFVDDGSLDNTEKIVKKIEGVNYYKINHSGVSCARNFGISKAKGKYFLFIDIDDYVDKDLLLKLDSVTKREVDLVKYGYNLVDSNKKVISEHQGIELQISNGETLFERLCLEKEAFDLICIYLYNLNFWKKNNFSFAQGKYHEDFGLIPLVILKSKKVVSLSCSGYFYVQTNNSITRTSDVKKNIKKAYDYFFHYDFLYDKVNNCNDYNSEIKSLFNSYISNAVIMKLKTIPLKERKKYLREIKKRNIFDNLKSDTIIRKIKKIVLKLCPNLYLKVVK